MRTVNISELKDRLSAYVAFAREGEEIVIRDRNLPVAKLVPFLGDASDDELKLVAAGKMKLPEARLDRKAFWKIKTGTVSSNQGILALLEDRGQSL